MEANLQAA